MTVRITEKVVLKDPAEVIDFAFDWSDELGADTISTSTWAADAGITIDADSETATVATVTLSGGTAGTDYMVTNTVVTDGAKTHLRTFHVKVRNR